MKKIFIFLTMNLLFWAIFAHASYSNYEACINEQITNGTNAGATVVVDVYPGPPPYAKFTNCIGSNCTVTGAFCYQLPDANSTEGLNTAPNPPTPIHGLCPSTGSQIDVATRSEGETIPIVGTPFYLYYSSARGRRLFEYTSHTGLCETAIAGGSLPDCRVDVAIAGTSQGQSYIGGVAPTHDFVWNGLDSSSNRIYFSRIATITYSFLNLPSPNSSWYSSLTSSKRLGTFDSLFYGLGGWGISVLHAYDTDAGIIYYGDGLTEPLPAITQSNGDLWIKSPSRGEIYVFSSDGHHMATKSQLLGDAIYTFSYNGSGHLTSITDAFGKVTTINRSSGVFSGITSPYSMATTVSLNSDGFIYTVTDPNSKVTTVTYADSRGLIASFARPGASATTFTHASDGRLITDLNPTGRSLTYAWDPAQLYTTETSALGLVNNYSITDSDDPANRGFAVYMASGLYLNSSYGSSNIGSTDGDGTHSTTFAADGRDSTFKQIYSRNDQYGPLNRTDYYTNSYTLSTPGDIFSTTTAQWTHTLNSNVDTTDYDNSTKTYTFTSAASRTSTRTIDTHERTTQITIPHLSNISFTYDSNGRPSTVTQGSRSITYGYDTNGFLNSVTDALSHVTGYTYNSSGFLTGITLPDTRSISMTYDDRGNRTSITDPKSHTTSFSWNGFDKQTQFHPPLVTGISAPQTDITYTTDQNVDTITRPDSQVIDYDYDATTGLLTQITTPQGTSYITMNPAGRLTNAQLGDNTTTITRAAALVTADRITQLNSAGSGYDMALAEFGFNSDGTRSSVSIHDYAETSTLSASFGYDSDLLLTTAGDETLGYNADNGLLETIDNGNVHITMTHNTNGDLDTYTAKYNSTTLYTYTLTYYNDGRIHTMSENIQGTSNSYSYTYDAAGRLSTVTKNSTLISSYTYDNNGNRTSGTKNSVSFSATYDAQDRMSTWNTYSFAYNDNGETTSRTNSSTSVTTNYTYDVYGHMMEAAVSGGMDVVYNIDPLGRRIKRKSSGTETARYLYDGQHRVLGEVSSTNTMDRLYVYGSRANVADYYTDGTDDYQFFVDPIGSVRLVVKTSSGTVSLRRDYDEFGIITNTSGSNPQPFGFAGGVYDAQTNFYHFGEREYDPETGRWLSKDPIGFGGGDTNLYGYAIQDPVNGIDPSGLSRLVFDGSSLYVYPGGAGTSGPPQRFPANNRTSNPSGDPLTPNSHGPAPDGTFPVRPLVPTGNDPNSPFGTGFYPISLPPGPDGQRTGVGIHSGRADRGGAGFGTNGCIRTNDSGIGSLLNDPPSSITIGH